MGHRIVALDMGGVVVDVSHERCASLLGRTWAECEKAFFDGGLHDELTVGAVGGEEFVRTAAGRLKEHEARVRVAWSAVVDVTPEGRAVVADLLRVGHRVHLWSNTDPIHLARMLAQLPGNLSVVSDTVSFQLRAMKPQPSFFERALAHGEPDLFLDDRADIIAAAHNAKVKAQQCAGPREARRLLTEAGLL